MFKDLGYFYGYSFQLLGDVFNYDVLGGASEALVKVVRGEGRDRRPRGGLDGG